MTSDNMVAGISLRGGYRVARHPMQLRQRARGRYLLQVINPDGTVEQSLSGLNLILNQGLDTVATYLWCDCFKYCAVGAGQTATATDSGTTVASQSGTVVTLSGGSLTLAPTDEGRVIRWDSGQESMIISVSNDTQATVTPSQAVGSGQFTLYHTNQLGLTSELRRTGNYVTAGNACGSTLAGSTLSHQRTFEFPAEVGSVTYHEVGFSRLQSGGYNLFSRIKLPTGVGLVAGQVLRVTYTLGITVGPATLTAGTANITGWPVAPATDTNGDMQLQLLGLSAVNSDGTTGAYDAGGYVNEPSHVANAAVFLAASATAPAALGNTVNRTGTTAVKALALDAYVAQSFTRTKSVTLADSEGNGTTWRSLGVGRSDTGIQPYQNTGFVFVFDQNQTKDNLHTLELQFLYSWGRTLA